MAAGDWENLIPSNPNDPGLPAARTRYVNISDENKNLKSVKAVWFADENGTLHKIWERDKLYNPPDAGSNGHYACLKYVPEETVVATTVSVLTVPNSSGLTPHVLYILDADGVLIGKYNEEDQENGLTVYKLSGLRKRTITLSPSFTFEAGKTYWLHYYYTDNRAQPPVCYQDKQGRDYKNISCNSLINVNPLDPETYLGVIGSSYTQSYQFIDYLLTNIDEGDTYCAGKNLQDSANRSWLTNGHLYKRSSYSLTGTYSGTIFLNHTGFDAPNAHVEPTMADLAELSENEIAVIQGKRPDDTGDFCNVIRRKAGTAPTSVNDNWKPNETGVVGYANVVYDSKDANYCFTVSTYQQLPYPYQTGLTQGSPKIFRRTSVGTIDFQKGSPVDISTITPVEGHVYYVERYDNQNNIMVIYINGAYSLFDITKQYNGEYYYEEFNATTLYDDITADIYNNVITFISNSMPKPQNWDNTPVSNDYCHYMEINGNEIFGKEVLQ